MIAEEQICFLLLSVNTNEKINSDHFPLLKTEAGPSVLLHQNQGRPNTARRLAGSLGKSTHWTFLLIFCCGGLLCSLPWALLAVGSCFESLTPAGWSKHLAFIQTQLLLGSGLHHKEEACPQLNRLLHLGGGVEKENEPVFSPCILLLFEASLWRGLHFPVDWREHLRRWRGMCPSLNLCRVTSSVPWD